MPYIKRDQRDKYKKFLIEASHIINAKTPSGDLNYIITNLIHLAGNLKIEIDLREFSLIHEKLSYARLNELIGVLECVKQEFYRKIITPYEEKKEKENGRI